MRQNRRLLIPVFIIFMVANGCDQKEIDYSDDLEVKKWAEKGDAGAQHNLGLMYYDGEGVVQDYIEAVKWYRKAADQGDAPAQAS